MVYAVMLSLVLLLPLSSMAQDACGNLNNYKDLIKCAQEKSPEIAKAQSLVEAVSYTHLTLPTKA